MTDATATPAAATATPTPAAAPAADATLLGGLGAAPSGEAQPGDTPPAAASDAKPGDAKPAAPGDYQLQLPETSLFDAAALEGIATFARELDLSPEAAQKLVERDSRMLEQFADHIDATIAAEHKERVANWAKETKESKDLGGEKYAETEFLAGKALGMFATPELRAALNDTGFGNHPEIVRLFVKIGKAISEDSFTTKGAGEQVAPTDVAKTMFPTMN